jgi:hypothetical protein
MWIGKDAAGNIQEQCEVKLGFVQMIKMKS